MADQHAQWSWRRGKVALDDVSVTEWRDVVTKPVMHADTVALDDVSVTEWRPIVIGLPQVVLGCTR